MTGLISILFSYSFSSAFSFSEGLKNDEADFLTFRDL